MTKSDREKGGQISDAPLANDSLTDDREAILYGQKGIELLDVATNVCLDSVGRIKAL